MSATHLSGPLYVGGVPVLTGGLLSVGNSWFVDPVNGADGNSGAADSPFQTLLQAYNVAADSNDDVIYLKSYDGTTTGTARIASAFTWAKNNLHLVGICAPISVYKRARIAETSGAAIANLFTISGSNCGFYNLHWFHGNATDQAEIAVKITGQRNYFNNCHMIGIGSDTAAARTDCRSVSINPTTTGQGEHTFDYCVIGTDTVDITAATSQMDVKNGSPRNTFRECVFLSWHTGAGGDGTTFVSVGSGGMDRFLIFDRCRFLNAKSSSGRAMTVAATVNASAGGDVLFTYSTVVGCTDIVAGNPTNVWVDGAAPTAGTSDLAVNYTA